MRIHQKIHLPKRLLKTIVAASSCLFSGCTVLPDAPFNPSEKRITNQTRVTWELVSDVANVCKNRGLKLPPNLEAAACSFPGYSACHIVTSKTPTMFILGHELRHCFEGAWHD